MSDPGTKLTTNNRLKGIFTLGFIVLVVIVLIWVVSLLLTPDGPIEPVSPAPAACAEVTPAPAPIELPTTGRDL